MGGVALGGGTLGSHDIKKTKTLRSIQICKVQWFIPFLYKSLVVKLQRKDQICLGPRQTTQKSSFCSGIPKNKPSRIQVKVNHDKHPDIQRGWLIYLH